MVLSRRSDCTRPLLPVNRRRQGSFARVELLVAIAGLLLFALITSWAS